MTPANGPRVVVVTGDVTMDWKLARLTRSHDPEAPGPRGAVRMSGEPGGASLLASLVSAVAADMRQRGAPLIEVRAAGRPGEGASPADRQVNHFFAVWSEFERHDGARVWRISEALGLDPAESGGGTPGWAVLENDPPAAELVVVDAGLNFDREELWPNAIRSGERPAWVVLKMGRPVASGRLWDHLCETRADRLIVVVRAKDLRLTDAQISQELSWERTAQDLMWELTFNPQVKALSRCAHLVVSCGTAGGLLLSSAGRGPRLARMFFDPRVMEEEWTQEQPGGMIGYTCTLTAAVAREVMLEPQNPDLRRGIRRGISAMRTLWHDGYQVADPTRPQPVFPIDRVVTSLAESEAALADVLLPEPTITTADGSADQWRPWTILEQQHSEGLEGVARRIVVEGPDEVTRSVPVGRFGELVTVDRQEIEGYRSIRLLIAQYARRSRPERPLSVAVFGPPGSGKSFGINQIARSMFPELIEVLTFNLSQFHDPAQLVDALHQVRDQSLKGKLPLVFWDEFDTTLGKDELGWLRHFLAPMQDGEFQQGQVTHHIGPAIFVFAGGTRHHMRDFSAQDSVAFRKAKGPDFVSRLSGFVDILGPNPLGDDPKADPAYMVRRAILLRSLLQPRASLFRESNGRTELQVDSGVLQAFLRVRAYLHGARSMESILAMSSLNARSWFERSCLPSEAQLALHVDPRDFMDLVRSLVIEGPLLDEVAEAVHVSYCADQLEDGASWAEEDDEYLLRHSALEKFAGRPRDPSKAARSLIAYDRLPRDDKEQNREFAREIPSKLEAVGYQMRQARAGEPGVAFPDAVIELLAEQEHDRWIRSKLRQGWSWGSERDDVRLLHPDMLPWRGLTMEERTRRHGTEGASRIGTELLPQREKDKDRGLIRGLATVLAARGYRVTKIDERGDTPANA